MTQHNSFEHNPYTPPTSDLTKEYPSIPLDLDISMKIIALAPQFYLYDKSGNQVGFIKQKLFKLKEVIQVFNNDSKTDITHTIGADRILDLSAGYTMTSTQYGVLGKTKRLGMKSLWRTEFHIYDKDGNHTHTIQLANPFAQFIESIISLIPIVGDLLNLISGYFLNPTYHITDNDDNIVAIMKKRPALFEGKYEIESQTQLDTKTQELLALSLLTVIIIQRASDG